MDAGDEFKHTTVLATILHSKVSQGKKKDEKG